MIDRWYENIVTGEKAKLVNIEDTNPHDFSMFRYAYVLEYASGERIRLNYVVFRAVWDMI